MAWWYRWESACAWRGCRQRSRSSERGRANRERPGASTWKTAIPTEGLSHLLMGYIRSLLNLSFDGVSSPFQNLGSMPRVCGDGKKSHQRRIKATSSRYFTRNLQYRQRLSGLINRGFSHEVSGDFWEVTSRGGFHLNSHQTPCTVYPCLPIVNMRCGSAGSSSSLRRRLRTCIRTSAGSPVPQG